MGTIFPQGKKTQLKQEEESKLKLKQTET